MNFRKMGAIIISGFLLFNIESSGATEIPTRDQIDQKYKWKLEDIYDSSASWEQDFAKVEKMIPAIEAFKGKLGDSAETFLACMKLNETAAEILGKLYVYSTMRYHEDTSDTKNQGPADRASNLSMRVDTAGSFVVPEILAIPEERIKEYLSNEILSQYRFYISEILRAKDHILSPEEERILANMGEIFRAPENTYSMLTDADMTFPSIKDEKGEETDLSEERFYRFLRSGNRDVRKAAFDGIYDTYGKYRNTIASTLNSSVKTDAMQANVRKYPSALAAALDDDNIPIAVYKNLIDTVNNNLAPLHDYMKLKKSSLKLEELHMYDLYTPMVPTVEREFPYEEAKAVLIKALAPLGEEYLSLAGKGLENGWIDVYENKGKRSGAYSWGSYGTHPYILLNYNNTMRDIFTLAHELGHALHSFYSDSNQPITYSAYTTFVAEVASTTNEQLLIEYLLKNTTDKAQKLDLLNYYLEQVRTVVYRQALFAEFEMIIHEKAEKGEPLTNETFCKIWHELNVKYYGPDVVVDEKLDMEWARIPHFYSAFYVYQYVTGYAAASSLAGQILSEGKPAADRYIDYLKKGCSEYSIDILNKAGVDMSTPKPIEDTIKNFADKLEEMKRLMAE